MIMERCIHGIKNPTNCVYCGTMPLKHEIQTLRAKVASADVLVEALKMNLNIVTGEVLNKNYLIKALEKSKYALSTYDKLSETNTEVGE